MKYIIILLISLACCQHLTAQSLSLFDVDASNFPTMKAKFWAFDAAGKQQRPGASELTLKENGMPCNVTDVNFSNSPVKSLSVCVMVNTYKYLDLARTSTQKLINILTPSKDELAITFMNHGVQIHRDFTSDFAKARVYAANIPNSSGTDAQSIFYYPVSGGIPFISNRSTDKKVLILVSDANYPKPNLDTVQLYKDATDRNISIYCILLNTNDNSGLFKHIAARTGGKVFEFVSSEIEITDIDQEIERRERYTPCEITWQSSNTCKVETDVQLTWNFQTVSSVYTLSVSKLSFLQVNPSFVRYRKIPPGTISDTTITLTAQNIDITVTDIRLSLGSSIFSVINTSLPITIPRNNSKTITLRYAPTDSNSNYSSFEITTNHCIAHLSASSPNWKEMNPTTLKLIKPNGGETLAIGSETVITWEGVSAADTVSLEYSNDNGNKWNLITKTATNREYLWKNIPKPTSYECKIRVRQKNDMTTNLKMGYMEFSLVGHTYSVGPVSWSPDGSRILTASQDSSLIIWDVNTGSRVITLKRDKVRFGSIQWSPDGSKIVTGSNDKTTIIWDASKGIEILTLSGGHNNSISQVSWSPDGLKVATADYGGKIIIWNAIIGASINTFSHANTVLGMKWNLDGSKIVTASADRSARIWDIATGKSQLLYHTDYVEDVDWSPDNSKVATACLDNTAIIWDATSGLQLLTLKGHNADVVAVKWSPDGSKVATRGAEDMVILWDPSTGKRMYNLIGGNGRITDMSWHPDGSKIATATAGSNVSPNSDYSTIWDAATGERICNLYGHTDDLRAVQWSPDGTKIATGSQDKTVKIWSVVSNILQEDESDSVFSKIESKPVLMKTVIDMGKVLVNHSRDSTVTGLICSKGSVPLHVVGINLSTGNTNDFSIPIGAGDFFLDSNECRDIMFEFRPTQIGNLEAKATIKTTVGDFTDTFTISGQGIAPSLEVINKYIDFGKVLLGAKKDTIQVVTIKNVGTSNLTISKTDFDQINIADFSIVSSTNSFVLKPNESARMDLRFKPIGVGRTSGILQFHYEGIGTPETVQLFGEGIDPDSLGTTVLIQNIKAQAGEKVNLILKLQNSSGLQLPGAPTEWSARVRYNKSILFNLQTNNICSYGTDDSCGIELKGTYKYPQNDTLSSIPCIATLGNTDRASLIIEDFRWTNGTAATANPQRQNGAMQVTGICEDGGVRLFIPAKNATSLSTRPNPAQNSIQIQYGLREPLNITLELLSITGQVVQTIVNNQQQVAGQYTLMNDMSMLGNGIYSLRMTTNKEVLTTRVDVVK